MLTRSGKIILVDYDRVIFSPASTDECSYCLQANEVELLLSALEVYNWLTRWYSDADNEIVQDDVDAFVDGLRNKLMASCADIVLSRIDADGNWQISTDGGTTWTDAPQQDPRLATPIAPPAPGSDGPDKACAGANSIITYFKQLAQNIHDSKNASANLSDFTAVVVGILLILGIISGGWLFAALGALIGLLWANTDLATWDAAINDDMWQKFICAIYPFINEDATVTDYVGLKDAVEAQLDDTVARATWLIYLGVMGNAGLTNAARAMYGGALDCVCGCSLAAWDVYDADAGTINEGTRTDSHVEIAAEVRGDGHYYVIFGVGGSDHCCQPSVTVIDGADNEQSAYWPCGEPFTFAGSNPVLGTPSDHCIAGLLAKSTVPFTIAIDGDGCP